MKTRLMYRDHDLQLAERLPLHSVELEQDLELELLLHAMGGEDKFLRDVTRQVLLDNLSDADTIGYRQNILLDCIHEPQMAREIYKSAVEAIFREKRVWGAMLKDYPEGVLYRSVEVLEIFVEVLKRLRDIAREQEGKFYSEGFKGFFSMLKEELNDEYLAALDDQLEALALRTGVRMTSELGIGGKGSHYLLQKPPKSRRSWRDRFEDWKDQLGLSDRISYTYDIADRDEAGFRALSELRAQGIAQIAKALAESTDHILGFFKALRTELAFYVCCLNLHDQLRQKGEPTCFPKVMSPGRPVFGCTGLYDVVMSLRVHRRVVGNDVVADDKNLVMITGANRGGKSTFLRSVGLAMLMAQSGMFVGASSFCTDARSGIYTHFKREEDAEMKSGKLDEELSRMSSIVDELEPGGMVLLNESFAATNEREGSEIARQIVKALTEVGVKVFYVTHMYDFSHSIFLNELPDVKFLRAERLADGRRTFRLVEGEPLPTSYGEDLYRKIFEGSHHAA